MLSTRQSIFSTFIGTAISLLNAIIQFLAIFFVLLKFGSHFNGFIRLVMSFSLLIVTADGALGLATTLLLVKPIVQNDWITANEIYSTSKKNYRKAAIIGLTLALLTSFAYPLYAGITSSGSIFDSSNWQNIGIVISGTEGAHASQSGDFLFAGYWVLVAITLAFSLKNFFGAFFFNVYENILAAENKTSIRKIIILFTDLIVYSVLFLLLSISNINPLIPFLSMFIYSPLKGLLVYFYVKKKYIWLKYYRDVNNSRLATTKNRILISTLGTNILVNSDILIIALVLGLNVSSILSLYLVIAINTRLIMMNFITSFREFFVTLITKKGRLNWESYVKYELYTYLIAGFTFINMAVISPYFVNALYGNLAASSLQDLDSIIDIRDIKVYEFMFFDPRFSIIYAATTTLTIMGEAQTTIIYAKRRYKEVSKFQNYLGIFYLVITTMVTYIFILVGVGGDNNFVYALTLFYSLKIAVLLIRYIYLWLYVWKYVTYNSTLKYVLNNFLILLIPILTTSLLIVFVINPNFNIRENATNDASIVPLIGMFFGCIISSFIFLMLCAYIFSPKMMNGIIKNFPIISRIVNKKRDLARKKRFEEFGINIDEITDRSSELTLAMHGIIDDETTNPTSDHDKKTEDKPKNKEIYVIKGK